MFRGDSPPVLVKNYKVLCASTTMCIDCSLRDTQYHDVILTKLSPRQ